MNVDIPPTEPTLGFPDTRVPRAPASQLNTRPELQTPVVCHVEDVAAETAMSDEVSDFLRSVELLKERREEEDEARSRDLEEKILQEKRERQARRAGTSTQTSLSWGFPPPKLDRGRKKKEGVPSLPSCTHLRSPDSSPSLIFGPSEPLTTSSELLATGADSGHLTRTFRSARSGTDKLSSQNAQDRSRRKSHRPQTPPHQPQIVLVFSRPLPTARASNRPYLGALVAQGRAVPTQRPIS